MSDFIDIGFRWIDDISIELLDDLPADTLQLKIYADVDKTYVAKKGRENIIRPALNKKIPCNKKEEVVIELYGWRRKYGLLKKKDQISSVRIPLANEQIYTKKTCQDNDSTVSVTITFAYTSGGDLRERVEEARRITEDQKVVLDKIRHVHRFFKSLEVVCSAVEDLHPYIKTSSTAILSLYRICERQEECRDAAQNLVEEMDEVLSHGVEKLFDILRTNSDTKVAFKSMAGVIGEVSKCVEVQSQGMMGSLLRDGVSTSYKSKLEELHSKLKRAKEGLRDSMTAGLWKRSVNADLERKLKAVTSAHYRPGARCLPNTRVALLNHVDVWLEGPSDEKTTWVYGYAGSGKSALLNSIAKKLEDARIPFTCFTCKRDDAERSDVQRVLPTICYDFTQFYGDYRGNISDVVDQPSGRSISTGDVASQSELLFGESPLYDVISPEGARRPRVHVILIDALDECKDTRQRCALARFLKDLANAIPWIKVIITSRRESDIATVLALDSTIHRVDINADRWKASDDIRVFIEDRSKEMELNLSSDQLDRLQAKASGLFIWCTTVFRYIEESKESRTRIVANILKGQAPNSDDNPHAPLYLLYQQVLDSAVTRASDRKLMESVLSVLLVAATRRPLSAGAIADILYPNEEGDERDEKREWVGNIIKSLLSIVYVEEGTNAVRACHLSVLDFIGKMLSGEFPFTMKLEEAHARVFEGCFSIMNRTLKFNMCELEDSFRLNTDVPDLPTRIAKHIIEALQYASLFWSSHLEQSGLQGSDAPVLAFLNSPKTLYWVEALSLMNVVDRAIVVLQDCARFFTDQPRVAEIAGEWEWFLLAYGEASKSTPHLYLSALPWIPCSSRLWAIVRGSFSSELPIVMNMPETWNSERWSENVGTRVRSVAYSADGRLFAAGCEDGSIRLWEARSGKVARELFFPDSWVMSITFSPDNRWLASGHDDDNVRLCDLWADSAEPRVLEGHVDGINSVGFSSDSRRVVSGSCDESIRVWDVESGTAIGEPFMGHENWVTSATFSTDGTRIFSGSADNTLRIWNSMTGEQIGAPLQGHSHWVRSVACSRDGRFIASASHDKTIRLWDAETYEQIGHPLTGHTDEIYSVGFSADSTHLASGSNDHSVRIWNIETRSSVCVLRGHTNAVSSVAFSPSEQEVLSGSFDDTVRVWNTKDPASVDQPSTNRLASVSCVSYVPYSSLIASASDDGSINLWDTDTGAAVGTSLQGHTDAVSSLAVFSNGRWLVSGSFDNTLRLWDIASGTPLGEPMLGHTGKINSVAVSPNNRLIASASDDKTVRLWNATTRQQKMILEGHKEHVTCVTFSVDGNYVISGSLDDTIRLWDTRTGEAVGHPLKGHRSGVSAVTVSLDGQWIASTSWGTVRIWSMSTLSVVHVLDCSDDVDSVAFSGDSQFLISSLGMSIKVWNVHTGGALGYLLKGHTLRIRSVAFSLSGYEFASGSDDGTVRIWDTRARTDLQLYREGEVDYAELDEEAFRIRWNASRVSIGEDDGWIKDGEKLLLWAPWQRRYDIRNCVRIVVGAQGTGCMKPQLDHRKLFRYTGTRWKGMHTAGRLNGRMMPPTR